MMQTAMYSAGINEMRERHLLNPPKPLVPRMSNDVQQEVVVQRYKAIYGIIDDLT